jgi:hypothetical protein
LKSTRVVNLRLYWQLDAAWWLIEQQAINDFLLAARSQFGHIKAQTFSFPFSRLFSANFSSLLIIQSLPNMIKLPFQ